MSVPDRAFQVRTHDLANSTPAYQRIEPRLFRVTVNILHAAGLVLNADLLHTGQTPAAANVASSARVSWCYAPATDSGHQIAPLSVA